MSFRKENLDFKMEHSPDTKNLNLGLNATRKDNIQNLNIP